MESYLAIRVSSKSLQRIQRELKKLGRLWFIWENVEIMLWKDLKYTPTILYTGLHISTSLEDYRYAVEFPLSYSEEIIRTFNLLSRCANNKAPKRWQKWHFGPKRFLV